MGQKVLKKVRKMKAGDAFGAKSIEKAKANEGWGRVWEQRVLKS